MSADPKASGRKMRADRPDGVVELHSFSTTNEEAEAVAASIESALSRVKAHEIAVLVRSGYRADDVVAALSRRQLPISDWRGETYEVGDRRTLSVVLSVLKGRLNQRRAQRLCEFLEIELADDMAVHDFLTAQMEHPACAALLQLRERAFAGASASEVVARAKFVIECVDASRAIKIDPVIEAVQNFERHDPQFSVDDLLAEIALGSGGRAPTEGGGIKVASLHKTKGLQWPIVYLLGMEQGMLPDHRSIDEESLREERRTCFVGICRAEDELHLTFAQLSGTHRRTPSLFLQELDVL
ncbi:3'-5' exonuclease [Conexibacter sp. W3-3-2]|uniref:3'-5' exonuclease n=1 Tax=Conexibacter sp. W3-3-2 TaxID=2675227 RepID=UPI0028162239|nr:3'-5' exonuclease [Conexibacter sp. W3-3-2]